MKGANESTNREREANYYRKQGLAFHFRLGSPRAGFPIRLDFGTHRSAKSWMRRPLPRTFICFRNISIVHCRTDGKCWTQNPSSKPASLWVVGPTRWKVCFLHSIVCFYPRRGRALLVPGEIDRGSSLLRVCHGSRT